MHLRGTTFKNNCEYLCLAINFVNKRFYSNIVYLKMYKKPVTIILPVTVYKRLVNFGMIFHILLSFKGNK